MAFKDPSTVVKTDGWIMIAYGKNCQWKSKKNGSVISVKACIEWNHQPFRAAHCQSAFWTLFLGTMFSLIMLLTSINRNLFSLKTLAWIQVHLLSQMLFQEIHPCSLRKGLSFCWTGAVDNLLQKKPFFKSSGSAVLYHSFCLRSLGPWSSETSLTVQKNVSWRICNWLCVLCSYPDCFY